MTRAPRHTPIRSYAKQVWWFLGASALLALALLAPVLVRSSHVHSDQKAHDQVAAANHFWDMFSSGVVDSSVEGRLAHDLHPLLAHRNPAHDLLGVYVHSGQYPHVEDVLGISVYTHETGPSGREDLNQGYLSPAFVVRAVQATPGNVRDLEDAPPGIRKQGLLTWRNYVAVVAVPVSLYLVGLALLILISPVSLLARRSEARRKAAEAAARRESLPALAQEILHLQDVIATLPAGDPRVRKAKAAAARTLEQATTGASSAAERSEMRRVLDEVTLELGRIRSDLDTSSAAYDAALRETDET